MTVSLTLANTVKTREIIKYSADTYIDMHTSFLFCRVMTFTPWNCVFNFRKSCATCPRVLGSVRCGLLATLFSAATANRRLHHHSCRAPHHVPDMLKKLNSVALVRERTIPTERPPPVGEVSAKFCG